MSALALDISRCRSKEYKEFGPKKPSILDEKRNYTSNYKTVN